MSINQSKNYTQNTAEPSNTMYFSQWPHDKKSKDTTDIPDPNDFSKIEKIDDNSKSGGDQSYEYDDGKRGNNP